MPQCKQCGEHMHRRHRRGWQRVLYAAKYICPSCGDTEVQPRSIRPDISTVCRCPRCGNEHLRTFRRRDHIEGYRGGLFRWVQKLMGAKLRYCERCRLQFYDLRHTASEKSQSVSMSAAN